MEKRFWLGMALLGLFLAFGLLISARMTALHAEAAGELDRAAELTLSGDFSEACEVAFHAYDAWLEARKFTASVADHSPMDDVEQLFAEMEIYAKTEEKPHFAACCRQLGVMLRSMYDAHRPTWWNFL